MTGYQQYQAYRSAVDNAGILASSTITASISEEIARLDSENPDGAYLNGKGELQRLQDLRAVLFGGVDSAGVSHQGEL